MTTSQLRDRVWRGRLARFVLGRVALLAAGFLVITLVVYWGPRTLADPAAEVCGFGCDPEGIEAVSSEYGFDDPFWSGYVGYVADVVRGDWGRSAVTAQPIAEALAPRAKSTLTYLVASQMVAVGVGLVIGLAVSARVRRRRWRWVVVAAASFPLVLGATWLTQFLAVRLGWTELIGWDPPRFFNLPAVAILSLATAPAYILVVARSAEKHRGADFVAAARTSGQGRSRRFRTGLARLVALDLVSVAGRALPWLVGAVIVGEIMFAINGVGSYLVQAIFRRDYIQIAFSAGFIAFSLLAVNVAVDLIRVVVDPRLRRPPDDLVEAAEKSIFERPTYLWPVGSAT